jgi:SAM-dependent methyltransferase
MRQRDPVDWKRSLPSYVRETNRRETDSDYLRRTGLKPNVLELCSMAERGVVLDVGAADGWLLQSLDCAAGFECDIAVLNSAAERPRFVVGSLEALPFSAGSFDLIVASLVLMWVPTLGPAFREFRRVVRHRGRLVIAIVHPSYYRTGTVSQNADFVVERPLRSHWSIADLKIGGRSGPFTYFHHRYDRYFNAAICAGWKLIELREWFIDMEDYRTNVDVSAQLIQRTGKVPLYSFFLFEADYAAVLS